MEEANRGEANRCIEIGKRHLTEGHRDKALKFFQKAQRLCPSMQLDDLIDEAEYNNNDKQDNQNRYPHGSQSEPNLEDLRRRTASSTTSGPNRSRSSSPNIQYSADQLEAVKKVKSCSDYYQMLGLRKDFNENDLKKSYRKLALLLHPDKNKAPGAAEAFKAVGNAYATLSDASKRRHYDAYGNQPATTESNHYHRYGDPFDHEDLTPEEIFEMFFGGGIPRGHVYRRYHRRPRSSSPDANATAQHSSSLSLMLQLLPFFLLISLSLLSSLLMGDGSYSLHRTDKFRNERHTTEMRVPYYVKDDFLQKNGDQVQRIERQVEQEYLDNLRAACYRERVNKEQRLWQARAYGDSDAYKRASQLQTPSCERLNQIYYT